MATVIEGDQKSPFLIATTPRCRGGRYSFPWIAPLYSYNAECCKVASNTICWVFGMTQPGIEPRSPWPLANTLTIMTMSSILWFRVTIPIYWQHGQLGQINNSTSNIRGKKQHSAHLTRHYPCGWTLRPAIQ